MKYDCIIVLGGGITKEGKCSPIFERRLDLCIDLFKKRFADKIILSGKQSKSSPFNFIEARLMQKYLFNKGIQRKYMILEDKSKTTFENAIFSKEIVDKNNWKKIIVITSNFHMKRSKEIFKFIFGRKYKFLFKPADEGNVNKRLLKRRMVFEKAFLRLIKKEVFRKTKRGNSEEIKRFLDTSKEFNKMLDNLDLKLKDYKNFY